MKEVNRQFVIFGDGFNCFGFSDANLIPKDIVATHGFTLLPVPDAVDLNTVHIGTLPIRPHFVSKNNNIRIFFGTRRIHIEELNSTIESYDDFISLSLAVLSNLITDVRIKIGRLALNGVLALEDDGSHFKRFFKNSIIYEDNPFEWGFRTNTRTLSEHLKTDVNCVVACQKAPLPVDLPTGLRIIDDSKAPQLLVNYDYNTLAENMTNKKFTLDEIQQFVKDAISFRSGVIKGNK